MEFGQNLDEVLVFSDFGLKLMIWSLITTSTNRGVEIHDPKFANGGHSIRPSTGHLAILTRPETHDVIVLLAPRTHELVKSFISQTVDAQGLKWSPDGRWLTTWEAARMGYTVLIYTADGHMFKSYHGGQDGDKIGLGISCVEWDPIGNYLAIGSCDGCVTLLRKSTVSILLRLTNNDANHK